MVVNGCPISEAAFAMWTERLTPLIEATGASFFEATTAIALADFAARRADVGVIEVGLGGRLDSTNVVTPLVSAVTNVSREHTSYLGSTLEEIAAEKAGIAKPGVPFVIGETDPALAGLLARLGTAAGAASIVVPPDERFSGAMHLSGEHQRRNASLALAVLRALPNAYRPSAEAVQQGFHAARAPGRFDRRGRWIFDVAHNLGGVRVLTHLLERTRPPRPLHAIMAVLKDKDWAAMTDEISRLADVVWITHAPSAPTDRRWDLAAVAAHCGTAARANPDLEHVLHQASREAGTVLVCGSFHTVGDAMARLPGFTPLG